MGRVNTLAIGSACLAMLIAVALMSDGQMRGRYHDRQSPLPKSLSAVHTVTLLRGVHGMPEPEMHRATTALAHTLRSFGAEVVYMGRTSPSGPVLDSKVVPDSGWSAVVIAEHETVDDMETAFESQMVNGALQWFEDRVTLVTRRGPLTHAALAVARTFVVAASHLGIGKVTLEEPEVPMLTDKMNETLAKAMYKVDSLGCGIREVGCNGFGFLNLIRTHSDPESAMMDKWYGLRMMRTIWQHGGGLAHVLDVDPDRPPNHGMAKAKWDTVALMYYPGREYINDLFQSEYFANIVGDKKQEDTLVLATLPWEFPV